MNTRVIKTSTKGWLEAGLQVLESSELVAIPTDTVYGLGALVSDPIAIEALYRVKSRDKSKAIPVLIGEIDDLNKVALNLADFALKLVECFWPGPLTMVVAKRPDLPKILSPTQTIGIRMPDHPKALHLLKATGPLAVTSANRSGGSNSLTAQDVAAQLGGQIPLVLDGGTCPGGNPSTVVDCTGGEPHILREGPISLDQIRAIIA